MITYIYDGSFQGLLTSIYEAFYASEKPKDISIEEKLIENFLIEKNYIKTDDVKANAVYNAIEKKISSSSLKRIFYSYLSEIPKAEIMIFRYLEVGFKIGNRVDMNLANEDVLNIDRIYNKVRREVHRLTGLLRFKNIGQKILYAQVEPDHNVISLLAPHFQERLRQENFIIHDTKREIAVFYNKDEWLIRSMEKTNSFLVKDREEVYEDLWRSYVDAISIEGKRNLKLQKQNMPIRYWKNLTEKS